MNPWRQRAPAARVPPRTEAVPCLERLVACRAQRERCYAGLAKAGLPE